MHALCKAEGKPKAESATTQGGRRKAEVEDTKRKVEGAKRTFKSILERATPTAWWCTSPGQVPLRGAPPWVKFVYFDFAPSGPHRGEGTRATSSSKMLTHVVICGMDGCGGSSAPMGRLVF